MRKYLVVVIFWGISLSQPLFAQQVWPGDVNNNGVVNGVDLLYWGIAFGSSGPPRAQVSTNWEAVPLLSLWAQSFPDNTNYAFADCNGDGIVDADDFDDAIEDNFGLTHGTLRPDGYANAQPGAAPRLRLQPDSENVGYGATVNISLSLDDSAMPVNNFYGMALKLSYTPGILAGDDGPDFDFVENNWIAADNSFVQDLFEDNNGLGTAELATTRTNQQVIPVNPAEIGRFSIVIEDIIVGREIDTFRLQIDSIYLIDNEFGIIPVVPDTTIIIVSKDPKVTATEENQVLPEVKVFPNPARDEFFLESNISLFEPYLIDNLGRVLQLEARLLREGIYHLQAPPLPSGVYWLFAKTHQGLIGRKIIFLQP